jgi:hypothetical protein
VDVGAVMGAVEEGAARLEAAGDELYKATLRHEDAHNAYERAVEAELVRIHHEAKKAGERPPAEDLRRALAHQAIDDTTYQHYLATRAEVAAKDKLYRALAAAVSARQSLLKGLGGMGG